MPIIQILLAVLIAANCGYIFTYQYAPGPRSAAFRQTWLYTAHPALLAITLILAHALLTLHRQDFPVILGIIAGPYCLGVFISTFNLVFTCCSMGFFICLGLLHLLASAFTVLPLALCRNESSFAIGDFQLIPDTAQQWLPRRRGTESDKTVFSGVL